MLEDEGRAGAPWKDRSRGPCVRWVGLVGGIGGYRVPQESFSRSRAEAEVWHISVQLILLAWIIWFGTLSEELGEDCPTTMVSVPQPLSSSWFRNFSITRRG